MRVHTKLGLLTLASLAPAAAFAHPGPHRNEAAWILVHALTHPDHLLVIGVAVAVVVALAAWLLLALEPQR